MQKELEEFEFEIICDYKHNTTQRASFNRLCNLVFGFNFEEWYQKGFWDERYICHSIIIDDEVVANISVSFMDLVIDGITRKAIQIGTVMTHPEFRNKGFSGLLMKRVIEIYEQECELIILFANSSVLEFYPKFGFTACTEYKFTIEAQHSSSGHAELRKLNCLDAKDVELIKQTARSRRTLSEHFGVINNLGINMFYTLHVLADCFYYSEVDKAVVVFQHEGKTLHLYDIICDTEVDFTGLCSRISNVQAQNIQFHFTPDQFTMEAVVEPMDSSEDKLFIKANFIVDVNKAFCVPKLAHA